MPSTPNNSQPSPNINTPKPSSLPSWCGERTLKLGVIPIVLFTVYALLLPPDILDRLPQLQQFYSQHMARYLPGLPDIAARSANYQQVLCFYITLWCVYPLYLLANHRLVNVTPLLKQPSTALGSVGLVLTLLAVSMLAPFALGAIEAYGDIRGRARLAELMATHASTMATYGVLWLWLMLLRPITTLYYLHSKLRA